MGRQRGDGPTQRSFSRRGFSENAAVDQGIAVEAAVYAPLTTSRAVVARIACGDTVAGFFSHSLN
jgi:hypothetical protein